MLKIEYSMLLKEENNIYCFMKCIKCPSLTVLQMKEDIWKELELLNGQKRFYNEHVIQNLIKKLKKKKKMRDYIVVSKTTETFGPT